MENNIPIAISLKQFLKLMGWGRTKFYEVFQEDANLRRITFQEPGGRTSAKTFWLHEAIDYKNRFRLVKQK